MKKYKELMPGVVVSFAMAFMLCGYAPLELYFNNIFEFWYDLSTLLPVLLELAAIFVGISLLLFGILFVVNKKAYRIFLAAYSILYLVCYIHGNFFVANLPVLDGHKVDWSLYRTEHILSVLMMIIVTAVVVVTYIKCKAELFEKIVSGVSIGVSLMLLITLAIVCDQRGGTMEKLNYCITDKNLFEMSTDKNFIVLVTDCVDAGVFSKMLKENPEYAKVYEDFTYYDNAMCTYGFTEYSVPFMYSGIWYENHGTITDYGNEAFERAPLGGRLKERDYKIGMYYSTIPLNNGFLKDYNNVTYTNGTLTSWSTFAVRQIQLVGLRYAPYLLKQFCIFDTNTLVDLRKVEGLDQAYNMANITFYYDELPKEVTYTGDKVFKFIHVEGAHEPYRYDKDMKYKENATYEDNMQANLTVVDAYLNKLKEAGVYDNSVIMIMADHGYDDDHNGWISRQDPVVFIKGVGEKHPMQISSAPISYVDLQDAYVRLLDGAQSADAFDWKEGDVRERRFLWYEMYDQYSDMYEYVQTDRADNEATFLPTGKVFKHY